MGIVDPLKYFELSSAEAAVVSEISEAVAASNVPAEERVNLHIGNPIQHEELQILFFKLALGLPLNYELNLNDLSAFASDFQLNEEELRDAEFAKSLIIKSSPYSPRGGFLKTKPNFAAKYFLDWLVKNQLESLSYDLGDKSGMREVCFISGGHFEALRVFFSAIAEKLKYFPAKVLFYEYSFPIQFFKSDRLEFKFLNKDEKELIKNVEAIFEKQICPVFLILGSIPSEETRRLLRAKSLEFPIFFVEVNDAPNHYSLARESKMMKRALRFLSCGSINERLKNYSLIFAAGNSDYIKAIETYHFQLKGTPSVPEMEGFEFIVTNNLLKRTTSLNGRLERGEVNQKINVSFLKEQRLITKIEKNLISTGEKIAFKYDFSNSNATIIRNSFCKSYSLCEKKAAGFFSLLAQNIDDENFIDELKRNFITAFCEYNDYLDASRCEVVSGSSRTALSLLGFHCDFEEAIIPDLSWTYEHCFPRVFSSAPTENFELNIPELKRIILERIEFRNNSGKDYKIALALNNPHNATGMIFNIQDVEEIISFALKSGIYVIDDLSYSNVVPSIDFIKIPTAKEITRNLYKKGKISREEFERCITVQSVSKTDCLAGSRLAVVEILESDLFEKYKELNSFIKPNVFAIALSFLFYRNDKEKINAYYIQRNKLFRSRTKILLESVESFPSERNAFNIKILPPKGAMYPILKIEALPDGVSLENLAYNLARGGVGVVPLSAFARSARGYEIARSCFRLTLGGSDDNETLRKKARRLLIDLNRIIADLSWQYKLEIPKVNSELRIIYNEFVYDYFFEDFSRKVDEKIEKHFYDKAKKFFEGDIETKIKFENFKQAELAFRKAFIKNKLNDISLILSRAKDVYSDKTLFIETLKGEFYKDDLKEKIERFKKRLFDRTVHPTQIRSIKVEKLCWEIIDRIIRKKLPEESLIKKFCDEVVDEYLALNVPIKSEEEGFEAILDLRSGILAEMWLSLNGIDFPAFILSFWGDWDGSSRPSGQGHSIIAKVLIENIKNQIKLLEALKKAFSNFKLSKDLEEEIQKLDKRVAKFLNLLDSITKLTDRLEKQYKSYLPVELRKRNLFLKMLLRKKEDPESVFRRNLRLEKKMLELRRKRKAEIEYYFSLNEKIRKILYANVELIADRLNKYEVFVEAVLFRNYLSRFAVTPRIHQKMILAQDQFPIDTTVENIYELNAIGAAYGNPGLALLAQISMSTKAEAAIIFERKLRLKREEIYRLNPELELPIVTLAPLFEDINAVKNIKDYLEKIYERASQTKAINQKIEDRFGEIISEVFIAGSDLSQQVGQSLGAMLYNEAKFNLYEFLSFKNLLDKVRIKLGSGEPMQRQGNYYSFSSGQKLFIKDFEKQNCEKLKLTPAAFKSAQYAATPLLGVFLSPDLKTFQSYISEQVRSLPAEKYAALLWHLYKKQNEHLRELIRAGEPLTETRLQFKTRGIQELSRLTSLKKDPIYEKFLSEHKKNFRQITYGSEEDVVGLHIVSYFVGRSIPQLRDRPTARPSQTVGSDALGRRIIERIAGQIPLSKSGSLLRAISHNQAQTMILGIPQLTLGLSRTINSFLVGELFETDPETALYERVLPNLPVYEILTELRIYCEPQNPYLEKIERSFPPGNSSLYALGEDLSFLRYSIKLFQKELIRRHGLSVSDFFDDDDFNPELYRFLRADIAVIMQKDIFSTDFDSFYESYLNKLKDNNRLRKIRNIYEIRRKTIELRKNMWEILEEPISSRVKSFCELALALWQLTSSNGNKVEFNFERKSFKNPESKLFSSISRDENMIQFFADAFKYLSYVYETAQEVPFQVVKALKEVENLIKLDQLPIDGKKQDKLRYYLIQMGRLTGFNG